MKNLFIILFTVIAIQSKCQDKAIMKNDTVYYMDQKIYINKAIRLGYGSTSSKEFAFIYYGMTGTGLPAHWSKFDVLVEKIKIKGTKFWIVGRATNIAIGNKIYFELESAIDNKEVIL